MSLYPWIQKLKKVWSRLLVWTDQTLARLSIPPITEVITFVVIAGLYFFNAVRFSLPVGYAGFFSLMTEQLSQNGFVLPIQVPFYGPGGTPFAYPPLGLYVAAVVTGLFRMPIFDYLRWAPPLISMLAFGVAYILFREIFANRMKALFGTVLTSTVGIVYTSHATAAGMARAFALLFSMGCLLISFRIFRGKSSSYKLIVLSAILFGMTFLTHLSYAVFTLLSLLAFAFTSPRERFLSNCVRLALIGIGGLAVAAPWYLTVIIRYGAQVFAYAGSSHGSFGIIYQASNSLLSIPVLLVKWFYNLGRTWKPFALAGVSLLGFCYAIMRRRWLLPLWMISIALFLGEAARFEAMLASMLAADLIFDLASMEDLSNTPHFIPRSILSAIFTFLILGVFLAQGLKEVRSKTPALSSQALEVSTWIRDNSKDDASYLLLSGSHDLSEWFPYLTHRTPDIAYWGSEWSGDYLMKQSYFQSLLECVEDQSSSCVYHLIDIADIDPDLMILPEGATWIYEEIASRSNWTLVYDQAGFIVFAKNPE
jgi:hypothetical protein